MITCSDAIQFLNSYIGEPPKLIYTDPPFFDKERSKGDYSYRFSSGNTSLAFLDYMREFIAVAYKILATDGAFFLHCDYNFAHHFRLFGDQVFGVSNFVNHIIWCYSGPSVPKNNFPRNHDDILLWRKSDKFQLNPIRVPYRGKLSVGGNTAWSKETKDLEQYLKKGKLLEDWWTDIAPLTRNQSEKTGYPDQKPIKLLQRIIECSTKEGDLVIDPFGGSGTTFLAAKLLKRRFLGCDANQKAVDLANGRLYKLNS